MITILFCHWCFTFNSIIGSKHGFIHNLHPLKRSRGKGVQWFDFRLQTSPTKAQRVIVSNAPALQQIQHFQTTKTPVFLKNLTIKQDESDWIFNQQSNMSVAPNSDITFSYKKTATTHAFYKSAAKCRHLYIPAQYYDTKPKSQCYRNTVLRPKTTQESFGKVNTRNIFCQGRLHFGKFNRAHFYSYQWWPLITQLKNTYSYCLNNLTVKNF